MRLLPCLLLLAGLLLAPDPPAAPAAPGAGSAWLGDFDAAGAQRGTTLAEPPGSAAAVPHSITRSPNHSITGPAGLRVAYDALTSSPSRLARPGGTLTAPSALQPEAVVWRFLAGSPGSYRLDAAAAAGLTPVRRFRTRGTGATHLWLGQQHRGIPVFKSELKANLSSRGEIISLSGSPVPALARSVTAARPRLSPGEALGRALGHAGYDPSSLRQPLGPPAGPRRQMTFRAQPLALPAEVRLVYLPVAPGRTALAWETTLWPRLEGSVSHVLVDALTGELLYRKSYTHRAHGLVFDGDAPQDGTPYRGGTLPLLERGLRPFDGSGDFNGAPLFPAGDVHFDWWGGGPASQTFGANARGGTARAGSTQSVSPAVSLSGDFSFLLDLGSDPAEYQAAASANLFYWLNRCHDIWYVFGFDEAAGNFQTTNFGLGGREGDSILALAQFNANGLSRDNADMSTPPDGTPGLMRLFVFNHPSGILRDSSLGNDVICHEYMHGVTNRLVGNGDGLRGFQGGAMGEGWSDFAALAILAEPADDPDGAYPLAGYVVDDFAHGIRRQPYSADPTIFTRTYGDLHQDDGEVHLAGEIMANALWQLHGRLTGRLGFRTGRDRALQLLIDALKLCPDDPTFLDFRDCLLQADQDRFAGTDLADIWAAFASRGMGVSAATSGPNDLFPTAAFDVPDNVHSIAGRVTSGGAGLPGVVVAAGGRSATTGADGGYVIESLPPGQYPVTASLPDYAVVPAGFTNPVTLPPAAAGIDFLAAPRTYSISGRLSPAPGAASGARVTAALTGYDRSGSPGLPVPDSSAAGVEASLPILGTGTVSVVSVSVDVQHSFAGDLEVGLVHPDGTEVLLHDRAGSDPGGLATTYPNRTPPAQSLGRLAGKPARGTWLLRIRDLASGDTGTFRSWRLTLTTTGGPVTSTTPAANGAYAFRDLTAGLYTITPNRPGMTFTPRSRAAAVGPDAPGMDFQGTPTVRLRSLRLDGSRIRGGGSLRGTVTFDRALPAAVAVSLSASDSRAIPPPVVTVRRGASSAAFTVQTRRVSANTRVTLTGSSGGASVQAPLTLTR